LRITGDQTIEVERAEAVVPAAELEPAVEIPVVAETIAPIPRPASERPFAPVPDQNPTALGYASSVQVDAGPRPFRDFEASGNRPLSANPFYEAPRDGTVSSGDYLLDDRYGGTASNASARPGCTLYDYQTGVCRTGSGSSRVTLDLGN